MGEEISQISKQRSTEEDLVEGPMTDVLCASSLVGFCSPHSMKVRGWIQSQEVTVLIDSRASHNFITKSLVTDLQLRFTPTQEFGVLIGNEDEVRASGVCHGLCLQLALLNMVADFFHLKLGASDVVLGFQWLATLGDSVMNWGNLNLQVTLDECKVTIQGDPIVSQAQDSLNSMACTLKREGLCCNSNHLR